MKVVSSLIFYRSAIPRRDFDSGRASNASFRDWAFAFEQRKGEAFTLARRVFQHQSRLD